MVLATAKANADAGEVWKGNPWKADFIGVDTAFEVNSVLKGSVKGGRLVVRHYRVHPDQ